MFFFPLSNGAEIKSNLGQEIYAVYFLTTHEIRFFLRLWVLSLKCLLVYCTPPSPSKTHTGVFSSSSDRLGVFFIMNVIILYIFVASLFVSSPLIFEVQVECVIEVQLQGVGCYVLYNNLYLFGLTLLVVQVRSCVKVMFPQVMENSQMERPFLNCEIQPWPFLVSSMFPFMSKKPRCQINMWSKIISWYCMNSAGPVGVGWWLLQM